MPALLRIEHAAFGPQAWTEGMVRDELTGPRRVAVVAEFDGAVAGYAVARLGDTADIMTVGVLPDQRRRGIGRELTTHLIEAARQGGARAVFLEVLVGNEPALSLYGSLGFVPLRTCRDYYGPGLDALSMRLDLPGAP
jgi:ribosomal protein S18 acetylase RimI-like enzyme